MNRVARYRAGCVAVLVCGGSSVLGLLWLLDWNPVAAVVLVVVLLIPGRLQGFLYRDLFRGRRELDAGHPTMALRHLEQFLNTLQRQPWRRHALWLSWSICTPSAAAMALNNVGAAHLALGSTEEARRAWPWRRRRMVTPRPPTSSWLRPESLAILAVLSIGAPARCSGFWRPLKDAASGARVDQPPRPSHRWRFPH